MSENTYLEIWWKFITDPKTIVAVIGSVIAGAMWLGVRVYPYTTIDPIKLSALLASVEFVDQNNIVFKANDNVVFRIDNRWSVFVAKEGNLMIFDGPVPDQQHLKFSTKNAK